jgi:hypothetical protein
MHGIYDEADSVDPILLHRYYGASTSGNNGNEVTSQDPNTSDSDSDDSTEDSNSSDSPSNPSNSSDSSDSSDSNNSDGSDGSSNSGSEDDLDNSNNSNSSGNSGGSDNFDNSDNSKDSDDSGVDGDQEDRHAKSWQDIAKVIADSQKRNIRHDPAEVAKTAVPFKDEDEAHAFVAAFDAALASSMYPAGFGLHGEEYEPLESYKTGRSSKPLVIPLPYDVWFPRIVTWCKALNLLKQLQGTGVL